jgi:hypothetical protein
MLPSQIAISPFYRQIWTFERQAHSGDLSVSREEMGSTAFSSEVDTGSRKANASKQKTKARF